MSVFPRMVALFNAALLSLFIASTAIAETTTYTCNEGPACIDERVNFGTAEIKCTDINGDVLSDWVCEYEVEYSCKNSMTGEIRTGGFNPLSSSLCSKLCGPCEQGWK